MAKCVVVDTGALVALLAREDIHHNWARAQIPHLPYPWHTCDAVLSETCWLLGAPGVPKVEEMFKRNLVRLAFDLSSQWRSVFELLKKYADRPMSFADACLVRMSELLADPLVFSTDGDFQVYRRHGRQIIPCLLPKI